MGRKIFVSYKYADDSVQNLSLFSNSTVRDYVTEFEKKLEYSDHIYKGESDGEDLSCLSEPQIWDRLRDRIYDSSVTVVFISPQMRESGKLDKNQWIPWEISFSLKETSRKDRNGNKITSHSNAMLAVVLPDANGSYDYFYEKRHCCLSGCISNHTEQLFQILKDNMFNYKNGDIRNCNNSEKIWYGNHSYIATVQWDSFISYYSTYISLAIDRQKDIESYDIVKEIE